jgi:dTDP-4-amino-4,6-dideoxygalactose transaminase
MTEVREFENIIAEFYGAKHAVAVDCCTHAIELCLRYTKFNNVTCPTHTYLSVPMTFEKLNLNYTFESLGWKDYYQIGNTHIFDAAVCFKENAYVSGSMMCLSFQYKKHLSLGRGGMILIDNDRDYVQLKKMSYDGRIPDVPWAEQNIDMLGYHYYMTPETAKAGIEKFKQVKDLPTREWSYKDYPNISLMRVFNDKSKQ